ncbi:hypothetical protein SARC_08661 [Sphaeroforma arctica JP610]|uniref:Cortactin-binding protein-2 N-terminal domain-containing protein n=1 Tax=Sphaeroforma arctica JP610 TaxID=667725 RepID=A0A0L0FQ55_9EUKA|nr:hypothetical protein SARC_08661 [Sphaeroforma arctica JP610]KNC78927.1 hypothetical protein SARC_08661 [Sphaeroforma arctica JP610]|eukprot:XP_014152829.1 hypothetical protein SARC_08661 [Sphaeroforma arctica JP610]
MHEPALNCQLENERIKVAARDEELSFLKKATPAVVTDEEGGELIINTLLRKIEQLKKEKESLIVSLEQEEEHISNGLLVKLEKVKKEKIEMENLLEQEQEFIVNRLQKQIEAKQRVSNNLELQIQQMRKEKGDMENALEQEAEFMVNRLQKKLENMEQERTELKKQLSQGSSTTSLNNLAGSASGFSSDGFTSGDVNEEVKRLRQALLDNEEQQKKHLAEYEAERHKLQCDNTHLQQLLEREKEQVGTLSRNMTRLELEMEQEEEKQFNLLTSPTNVRKQLGNGAQLPSHKGSLGEVPAPRLLRINSTGQPGPTDRIRTRSMSEDMPLQIMQPGTKWWAHRSGSTSSANVSANELQLPVDSSTPNAAGSTDTPQSS